MKAQVQKQTSRLVYEARSRPLPKFKKEMVKRVEKSKVNVALGEMPASGAAADGISKKRGPKDDGAWRYPGGIVQRAPSLVLGKSMKEYYDPKNFALGDGKLPRRKIESNFFITLNTNKDYPANLNAEAIMEGVLDHLKQDCEIAGYLKYGPKDDTFRDDLYNDIVEKVEWQAGIERGDKFNRLHCHIWLTIYHLSQLQISYPLMQKAFKDKWNALSQRRGKAQADKLTLKHRPYIKVCLLPDSNFAQVMRNYMFKALLQAENCQKEADAAAMRAD